MDFPKLPCRSNAPSLAYIRSFLWETACLHDSLQPTPDLQWVLKRECHLWGVWLDQKTLCMFWGIDLAREKNSLCVWQFRCPSLVASSCWKLGSQLVFMPSNILNCQTIFRAVSPFCVSYWSSLKSVSSCVLLVVGLALPCQGSKTEIANEILHFCTLTQMNQRSHQLLAFVFHFTLFLDITQKSLIQNFLLLHLELHKPKWKQIRGTLVFP